ncbi:MAG: hypothetical protein KF912_00390 [Phycisphaeraceae bacterium]|nr:hypothetical protein [Phycisphaeraceae bacterium]MBX3365756.1 hypothetical protein [Phycisphaeraceae bacterium]
MHPQADDGIIVWRISVTMSQSPTPSPGKLEREMDAFRKALPSLIDRIGEYAVVVGDEIVGTYSTWEDACKVGYAKVGTSTPFLVKKIEEVETVNYFTRSLVSVCPT